MRIDRGVLHSQLESTVQQRDEIKRMYEALLSAINSNGSPHEAQVNPAKQITTSQAQLETNASLYQRIVDLEQATQVLRIFKTLYKSASFFKCGGCHREFKPTLFKAHAQICAKLLEQEQLQTPGASHFADRLFIKCVESLNGSVRFVVSQFGRQWCVQSSPQDFHSLIAGLQSRFPTAHSLQENIVKRMVNNLANEITDS